MKVEHEVTHSRWFARLFPILPGAGILRLSADGLGAPHRDIEKNLVRHALAGPDLACARAPLVDEGLVHLRRPIREEGEETARLVSGILLLPAFGVADPPLLTNLHCIYI